MIRHSSPVPQSWIPQTFNYTQTGSQCVPFQQYCVGHGRLALWKRDKDSRRERTGQTYKNEQIPDEYRATTVDHKSRPHNDSDWSEGEAKCWQNCCKINYLNISLEEQVCVLGSNSALNNLHCSTVMVRHEVVTFSIYTYSFTVL